MCVLRSELPGHLNVRAVLRHCVPNKGLRSLAPLCGYPLKTKCVTTKSHAFCIVNCLTKTPLTVMLFFWWGKVDSNFVRNVYYDFLRLKQSILFL